MPDDLRFSSKKGKVIPKTSQIDAGPWMDFSANFGSENDLSGVNDEAVVYLEEIDELKERIEKMEVESEKLKNFKEMFNSTFNQTL